jgi:hypothetical protein
VTRKPVAVFEFWRRVVRKRIDRSLPHPVQPGSEATPRR